MDYNFQQEELNLYYEDDNIFYKKYREVLKNVQEHISTNYPDAILNNNNNDETKYKIESFIELYLRNEKIGVKNTDQKSLINRLYEDMCLYGFLTPFLQNENVEEININAWNQIIVNYNNGKSTVLENKFLNPQHAVDVITRLLRASSMTIDRSTPCVVGHLSNNVRITANIAPVVDEDVGINASIRIINPKKLRKNDFVLNQTITETMFNFLTDVLSYGSSALFAGDTGSGKTTILGGILYDLIEKHRDKRIITIEQDMREFDLDQYDEQKEKISNVIYLKTRMSKEGQVIDNITQERLLQVSLTMNPDIITVGEMKSAEANSAQEAARTGHSVTGTIHSNSCRATYSRICTLCQMKYNLDYNILYNLVTEAFPVIVYCEKLADNKTRKIMEITECVIDEQGGRTINTLFRYDIEKYIKNDRGEIIDIIGKFVKVRPISENLRNLFYKKGISEERLKAYLEV